MRKLLLIISLLLLICLPVAANPVTLSGIGEVELGQNITVIEGHNNKGETIYSFKVKDGDIWRGACLFSPHTITDSNISNVIKLDVMLDKMIDEKFSKDVNFLTADKAKLLQLGSTEAASVTVKMTAPTFGIIMSMNMVLVSTIDGTKLLMFICADSDTPYWRPIFHKIISNIL